MTDRELMQQALDALESSRVFVTSKEKIKHPEGTEWYDSRITALRDRLAQPEQGPVAWYHAEKYKTHFTTEPSHDLIGKYWQPLYTHPPTVQPKQEKLGWDEYEKRNLRAEIKKLNKKYGVEE
jgi:hypothetical protein